MSTPISSYLKATGKTQREFADEMKVRHATVSAWVNGVTPKPEQMKRIALVTGDKVPVTAWFDSIPVEIQTGTA